MSRLFSLAGKTALITGSTSGIGLAIAQTFAAAGARVMISSIDEPGCRSVTEALQVEGHTASFHACNVMEESQLDGLVDATVARFDAIDSLIVNAGGVPAPNGKELSPNSAAYDETLHLNLRQAVRLTDRVAPTMAARRDGSIILMSSLSGLRGNKLIGAYALAKAAMAQLARNLAVQWGPDNVRANAISPGLIATPFSQGMMENAELMARRLRNTPLRRVGQPSEIAGAALFLASPAGAFVTGHNLVVDGGTIITDGN
jgi:NAD(P)-dependent dehydrogenase (short-subunit alcohol dehydrogenase family)